MRACSIWTFGIFNISQKYKIGAGRDNNNNAVGISEEFVSCVFGIAYKYIFCDVYFMEHDDDGLYAAGKMKPSKIICLGVSAYIIAASVSLKFRGKCDFFQSDRYKYLKFCFSNSKYDIYSNLNKTQKIIKTIKGFF